MVCNFSRKCRNYKDLNLDYAHDSNTFRDSHEVNVLLFITPIMVHFCECFGNFPVPTAGLKFTDFYSHSKGKPFPSSWDFDMKLYILKI